MKKLQIACCGKKIMIITDSEKVIDYFLNDTEFVPETIPGIDIKLIDESSLPAPRIVYLNSQDKMVTIDSEKSEAFISLPESNLYLPDLVYLALSMLARELNKDNKYFVHCSIVEKNNKGVVLIGEAGSGKTTLSMYLCMEHGYNFVCNDRAVIGLSKEGKPYVYAGTLQTHIRLGVIHEFFPQLVSKIESEKMNKPWTNKIYLNPEFENLDIKINYNTDISNIFYVFTYPVSEDETYIDEYDPIKERDASMLQTMQYLSEYIRADRNILLSADYPFPSFDSKELAEKRFSFVKTIADNVRMYDGRGNIKTLSKKIDNIVMK